MSAATSLTTSPLITVELFHVASSSRRVVDTTYLGMAFIWSAKPTGSSMVGQACREGLIGDPTEELCLGPLQLLELELVPFVAPVEAKGPTGVLEAFGTARVLHDPVQRNEFGYDDPAHDAASVTR